MRVLVADNDPEALDLVVLDLRLEGHVVAAAGSGEVALELMTEFRPDVLVLDYRMPPGPSGLDVAESARARWPEISMILYTNYQDVEIVRRARELNVVFLPKGNLRALRALLARPIPSPGDRSGPRELA